MALGYRSVSEDIFATYAVVLNIIAGPNGDHSSERISPNVWNKQLHFFLSLRACDSVCIMEALGFAVLQ